jgi:membrane fusion protein (multidrug efflux system)
LARPNAIVVPLESLVPEGDVFHVYVVDPNGVAHAREVKVGGKTSTVAEVTEGLRAGERVVAYGAYGVQDSAKVVPLKAAAPAADEKDAANAKGGDKPAAKPVAPVKP